MVITNPFLKIMKVQEIIGRNLTKSEKDIVLKCIESNVHMETYDRLNILATFYLHGEEMSNEEIEEVESDES